MPFTKSKLSEGLGEIRTNVSIHPSTPRHKTIQSEVMRFCWSSLFYVRGVRGYQELRSWALTLAKHRTRHNNPIFLFFKPPFSTQGPPGFEDSSLYASGYSGPLHSLRYFSHSSLLFLFRHNGYVFPLVSTSNVNEIMQCDSRIYLNLIADFSNCSR